MPKPILISLIPPVTIGGRSQPVVANQFDDSGNFRQRNGSFKRPRVEGGGAALRDGYFDLARDAVAPSLPNIPKLDLNKIRGLLVKANETAETIRNRIAADPAAEGAKDLAGLSIALLDLLNAVVEEGIIPMASPTAASFASVAAGSGATSQTTTRPRQEPGTAELKAALAAAEKTAVVFDADLGKLPAANRGALNGTFAAGLKAATMKVADESGGDAVECIRIVNDALSCVDNIDFVGQSSERKIDKRDPTNPITLPYCTMPVKLDFPDRNTRIHFERTVRKHCGMKASMSLPFQIRRYQSLFYKAMKARYPDRIVMVRPDTPSLAFVAFVKNEGGSGWSRCRETVPIPKGIMLPSYTFPNRVDLPTVADDEMGMGDDALLLEATIGAESQSQS
jgi:hypothetical protein